MEDGHGDVELLNATEASFEVEDDIGNGELLNQVFDHWAHCGPNAKARNNKNVRK